MTRDNGRCLCHGRLGTSKLNKAEGAYGPLRKRPADLIHRGGADWQCPHCFGLFVLHKKAVSMNRSDESQVREIFRRHIEAAIDEIADVGVSCGYLPGGYSGRTAEILTQALALAEETSDVTERETRGEQ